MSRKKEFNKRTHYYISPDKALFFGWIIWFFFFIISPYKYINLGNKWEAIGFLALVNIIFYIGLKLKRNKGFLFSKKLTTFSKPINQTLNITVFLGFLGTILSIYDKTQLITGGIYSISQNKIQILDAGIRQVGFLNSMAAILFPFSYVSFILLLSYRNQIPKTKKHVYLFISLLPVIFLALLGGRSLAFFYFFTAIFVYIMNPSKKTLKYNTKKFSLLTYLKKEIQNKTKVKVFFTIIFFVFFFVTLQKSRVDSINADSRIYFLSSQESQEWQYNKDHFLNIFLKENTEENVGILSFIHYQVHGVFEFIRLYSHLEYKYGYFYGSYQFYTYFKIFKIIGLDIGYDFIEMEKVRNKTGVFTTYWGPYFIDFGYFGVLLIFFIGRVINKISQNYNKKMINKLIYPFILTIIITSPILNTFTGALSYNFPAIILTSLIFYIKKQKT